MSETANASPFPRHPAPAAVSSSIIATLRASAMQEYADSTHKVQIASCPENVPVNKCERQDPNCWTIADGRLELPFSFLKDLGLVWLKSGQGHRMLVFSTGGSAADAELTRFLDFAARAGAAIVATPPSWTPHFRTLGNAGLVWVASLMCFCPCAVSEVVEQTGWRLNSSPWASSLAALKDWDAIPKDLGVAKPRQADEHAAPEVVLSGTLLSAPDIARQLRVDVNPLDIFLRRLRDDQPDCYQINKDRKGREPKYLYRVADVSPAIMKKVSDWKRPSPARRATGG